MKSGAPKRRPKKDAKPAEKAAPQPESPLSGCECEDREQTLAFRCMNAAALLYAKNEEGSMIMIGTATAIERRKNGAYLFVTAAHCVTEDDETHERADIAPFDWFIAIDDDCERFYPGKVVGAGYQRRGDDFAVLEVAIDREIPTVQLADAPPLVRERIINVASPLGLGKQILEGRVSMPRLRRPVVEDDINWRDAVLLQIHVGPGSSGSSVVSVKQGGIIAFLVGTISWGSDTPNVVALPVAKFRKFWAEVRRGKYEWYKPDAASGNGSWNKARRERFLLSRGLRRVSLSRPAKK